MLVVAEILVAEVQRGAGRSSTILLLCSYTARLRYRVNLRAGRHESRGRLVVPGCRMAVSIANKRARSELLDEETTVLLNNTNALYGFHKMHVLHIIFWGNRERASDLFYF